MELNEIFKDSPELIDHPEVKKLIEFAKESHAAIYDKLHKYTQFNTEVLSLCIHSDQFLVNGDSSKEVVRRIFELDNKL